MRISVLLFHLIILATMSSRAWSAEFPGVAVVELFTSEGCSSCPPADQLLIRIAEAQKKSGHAIYCLGWHVDYWDRLGWPDRFASPRFTQRQQRYARTWQHSAVYTPQMIVNGRDEFVGSNWKLANSAIADSLKTPVAHQLELRCQIDKTAGRCRIDYSVTPVAMTHELQLMLTESSASSRVTAGENQGETLSHVNIVRGWSTVALSEKARGTTTITLPEQWHSKHAQVIGFVQAKDTLAISGASAVSLTNP